MPAQLSGLQNQVSEWPLVSGKAYRDPFNELDVRVRIDGPGGALTLPAFWRGGLDYGVRFTPRVPGKYTWQASCDDPKNDSFKAQGGTLTVAAHEPSNALLRRGPLKVSANRRHLEHADGTPFFWLGDTWWFGATSRLAWPEGFQKLTANRVARGFTLAQIVVGLSPEITAFDPRGANEGGTPWVEGLAHPNPAYMEMADLRIQHLVRNGIVPCIVATWGYYVLETGLEKMKRHWRELVARYSCYPVVWCLAGEAVMPFYNSNTKEQDAVELKKQWTEVAKYLRANDPLHHPVTIHPTVKGREQLEEAALMDLEMLQTGHGGYAAVPSTVNNATESYAKEPRMPALVAEVDYEGLMELCHAELQRYMFFASMLSGMAGHTYGANGIWQMNSSEKPMGKLPHGKGYPEHTWEEAAEWPGARQVGYAKALLARYPWWKFEPHQDWIEPRASKQDFFKPYCAGVPREVRVIFIPISMDNPWTAGASIEIRALEPDVKYRAFFFDPRTGEEIPIGPVQPDASGVWKTPDAVRRQDWVVVLERH